MPWGSDRSDDSLSVATLDGNFIEQLYAKCASVYDWLFGPILQAGRREAMHQLALQPGNEILEIGIGTGLTTPLYIPTTAALPVSMCPSQCCVKRHETSTISTTSNCSEWTRHG